MGGKIIVIGAGVAGLSTAYHLKRDYEIFEKEKNAGGLARSREVDGFIFDYAGHIFFTKDNYALNLVNKLIGNNFHFQTRNSWVYSKNTYTRYPFQANTFGLPVEVVKKCVLGVIKARYGNYKRLKPSNFKEWIYYTFGDGIAEHFMIPYNKKLWTIPLEEMSYEWFRDRVPVPAILRVLEGALHQQTSDIGPNAQFGYPLHGGCESLTKSFLPMIKAVNIDKCVTGISIVNRTITLNNRYKVGYDKIVFTMPIPEIIKIIDRVPSEIRQAANNLRHISVLCVNLGFERADISNRHWIYYPEEKFIFHRNFMQSNASPFVSPKGTSSITCEISYSAYKTINKDTIVCRVIEDLIKADYINKNDKILVTDLVNIKYAYIIHDSKRKASLDAIFSFLGQNHIYPAGRYAEWEYYNMDHAILSGKRAAEKINRGEA